MKCRVRGQGRKCQLDYGYKGRSGNEMLLPLFLLIVSDRMGHLVD